MKSLRLSLGLLLGLFLSYASAQAEITSIADIRKLSAEEANEGHPVLIDAQVLVAHPRAVHFFVYADGVGIYVRRSGDLSNIKQQNVGDWVRIKGVTSPGNFSPSIFADEVTFLKKDKKPYPRPFKMLDLHAPASDCDWIFMQGRLTSIEEAEKQFDLIFFTIERFDSLVMRVQIPYSKQAVEELSSMLYKQIQIKAIITTVFNEIRQLTGRVFFMNSTKDIRLLDDAKPAGEVKSFAIHELMSSEMDHRVAVRTSGFVTYATDEEVYLRGEKSCLRVVIEDGSELQLGQKVEVAGLVWPQNISPAFRAQTSTVIEEVSEIPKPKKLALDDLIGQYGPKPLFGSYLNYELVTIDAEVVDVGKSFGLSSDVSEQWNLLCRSGSHLFEARLPLGLDVPEEVQTGTKLKLTGICNLIEDKRIYSRLVFESLWLQLRQGSDIVVLQEAPWWTPERLFWVSGLILATALLLLIWIFALRKTVDRQTEIIGDKIEQESILTERQRIARELHDNLEQGLTGTAIQLQGSRKLFEHSVSEHLESIDKLRTSLEDQQMVTELDSEIESFRKQTERNQNEFKVVQDMLSHCGEESRTSILDLRGGLLERMDLPAALHEALSPLADECGAQLDLEVRGTPRRLKSRAERNLMLVAREAASNAARHAEPKNIKVSLSFAENLITLSVYDDGCGFSVDKLPPAGHFGLQGMHERINRLGGSIEIDSALGEGSTVSVELSTADWELS